MIFSPTAKANGAWFSLEQLRCALVQAPGQVQRGSGEGTEGSGEGLEGFGAGPGQVQQGSGEGSREGSGEGLGGFGAEPGQVQQGSGKGSGEGVGGFGARRSANSDSQNTIRIATHDAKAPPISSSPLSSLL